jgi:hypothetical protein
MPTTKKNVTYPFYLEITGNDLWPAKAKLQKPIASQSFQLAVRTDVNCVVAHVRCIASLVFVGSVSGNWQTKDLFPVFVRQVGKVSGVSKL